LNDSHARLRIDVVAWRGSIAESRHRVQVAVCDAGGRCVAASDAPEMVTTLRSAAKPFQLLPLVERGHADRWGLSEEHLAVMAASHTGSPTHLRVVREILDRLELSDRDLACGYHDPLDPESLAYVRAHPEARSPLYNNCSGKHAGMLCLARSEGWPIEHYERPEHEVQRLMRVTVAEMCGTTPESLGVAVDGCSVSVFALPLTGMAWGYARLATASDGAPRALALARIRAAMQCHPGLTGGAGRLSTALMQTYGDAIVAKGGAEGLECAGLTGRGLGIALKCEDGATRAVGPALLALLDHLVERPPGASLEEWRRPVLHNVAGLDVGHVEAQLQVLETAPR
jgi:L-asparaginase II